MAAYREERISDLSALSRSLKNLDEDAGVRIEEGLTAGLKNSFLFVSRYRGKYWLTVFEKVKVGKSRRNTVGDIRYLKKLDTFGQMWRSMRPMLKPPLKAWLY